MILLRVLGDNVTENILIEKCPALSTDDDVVTGGAVAANPNAHFWTSIYNINTFYHQLITFLEGRVATI